MKFVNEDLSDILKPKSQEEIHTARKSLDVEEKEKVLFNIGMSHFEGSFDDFFEFLETELKDTGFWVSLTDIIYSSGDFYDESGNPEYIDEEWIRKKFNVEYLVEFSLSTLSEESIDKVLGKLIPGYLSEGMKK